MFQSVKKCMKLRAYIHALGCFEDEGLFYSLILSKDDPPQPAPVHPAAVCQAVQKYWQGSTCSGKKFNSFPVMESAWMIRGKGRLSVHVVVYYLELKELDSIILVIMIGSVASVAAEDCD